jgi:hypothetical protein
LSSFSTPSIFLSFPPTVLSLRVWVI